MVLLLLIRFNFDRLLVFIIIMMYFCNIKVFFPFCYFIVNYLVICLAFYFDIKTRPSTFLSNSPQFYIYTPSSLDTDLNVKALEKKLAQV